MRSGVRLTCVLVVVVRLNYRDAECEALVFKRGERFARHQHEVVALPRVTPHANAGMIVIAEHQFHGFSPQR